VRAVLAVALLVATALMGYGVGLVIWGTGATVPASIGLAITLPTAVTTLVLIRAAGRLRPDAGPVAVMAGTFLRMIVAVGAVVALRNLAAGLGTTPDAIANWTVGFYVLTLAAETGLLWWLSADRRPTGGVP
jgi:hypothetical protein